jgi:hypothetical protein
VTDSDKYSGFLLEIIIYSRKSFVIQAPGLSYSLRLLPGLGFLSPYVFSLLTILIPFKHEHNCHLIEINRGRMRQNRVITDINENEIFHKILSNPVG